MLIKKIAGVFDDPYPPNIGNIKIGKKGGKVTSSRGSEYRPPVKLGYFLITSLEMKNSDYVPDTKAITDYGAEPKEIPIVLPFPRIDDCLVTSYSYFSKQRRVCYGDGRVAFRYQEAANDYKQIVCDPEKCQFFQSGACKPYGLLKTYLRTGEDYSQVRTGGLFVFRTTSWTTLFSLYNTLYDIVRIVGDDNLMGLPLWLRYTHYTIKGPELRTVPNIVFEYRTPYNSIMDRRAEMLKTGYKALPAWMLDDVVEPDDALSDSDGDVVDPISASEPNAPEPKAVSKKTTDAAKVFNALNSESYENPLFGDVPEYVYKGAGVGDNGKSKEELDVADAKQSKTASKTASKTEKDGSEEEVKKPRRRSSSRRSSASVVQPEENLESSSF